MRDPLEEGTMRHSSGAWSARSPYGLYCSRDQGRRGWKEGWGCGSGMCLRQWHAREPCGWSLGAGARQPPAPLQWACRAAGGALSAPPGPAACREERHTKMQQSLDGCHPGVAKPGLNSAGSQPSYHAALHEAQPYVKGVQIDVHDRAVHRVLHRCCRRSGGGGGERRRAVAADG